MGKCATRPNSETSVGFWAFEAAARRLGYSAVAGVDEAGRGPLAGPVVAAAVIFPEKYTVEGVRDSKKLSAGQRDRLFSRIEETALAVGVGVVEAEQIDRINILQAALQAMAAAVTALHPQADYLLIDGIHPVDVPVAQKAVVRGDSQCFSIAAASIMAKVTRDRIMQQHHCVYPQFGFDRHKGYPTRAHREAIRRHGCCPLHRRSFKGIQEFC